MDELPKQIGPYEVRDRLGHGGMGVVYLGFDPMLDRPVGNDTDADIFGTRAQFDF